MRTSVSGKIGCLYSGSGGSDEKCLGPLQWGQHSAHTLAPHSPDYNLILSAGASARGFRGRNHCSVKTQQNKFDISDEALLLSRFVFAVLGHV